jgi:hypothetical protein
VPYKVPERIPVGVAVAAAGAYATGDWEVLEYAATKVLVYPGLAPSPTAPGPPRLSIDGDEQPLEPVADLGVTVAAEYRDARPRILAAALTRMAARAGVAEGARQAGAVHSDGAGTVAAILTEAALVALDRPDTRSWTFLPARVFAARVSVPAGAHTVEVAVGAGPGTGVRRRVDVAAGGFAALVVTEPR